MRSRRLGRAGEGGQGDVQRSSTRTKGMTSGGAGRHAGIEASRRASHVEESSQRRSLAFTDGSSSGHSPGSTASEDWPFDTNDAPTSTRHSSALDAS